LNNDGRHILRSKIGQILWVAKQSRPDVSFNACSLACRLKDAKVQHLILPSQSSGKSEVKRYNCSFRILVQHLFSLYTVMPHLETCLMDTQEEHMIFLAGENGKVSPNCWNSKRLCHVVRSTLAGETLALADGIDTGAFLST